MAPPTTVSSASSPEASARTAAKIVVVARHGERLDYKMRDSGTGEVWQTTAERKFDTPLTDHGHEQAEKLGKHLHAELERLGLPPLTAVYSSPFFRCRQTAVSARKGAMQAMSTSSDLPPVRVEPGLAESINESWYRSWALPGADGTWGFRANGEDGINMETLHPDAKKPVQPLLDWKTTIVDLDSEFVKSLDMDYVPTTTINDPYCFGSTPLLETNQEQRKRMRRVVDNVSETGKTVLLVSHGGPVTHLFEEMTGQDWRVHGESSYCCYSIYRKVVADCDGNVDPTNADSKKWEALAFNQAEYLKENIVHERHVD